MLKYWLLREKDNYLIAIIENSIYSGKINNRNNNKIINDLEKGKVPENFFNIPFSYIKSVVCPKGDKIITINYGKDSSEVIEIHDLIIKKEVINYLKDHLSKFEYVQKKPSIIKHTKTQIFGIIDVTGLFVWTFYLANEMSKGYEYEIVGRGGIAGLIIGLAQFGTIKVLMGYLIIITVAIFSFIKKIKSITLTEYLIRN